MGALPLPEGSWRVGRRGCEGGGGGSLRASERVLVSGRTLPEWMRRRRWVESSAGRLVRISRLREMVVVVVGGVMVRSRSGMLAVKRIVRRRGGASAIVGAGYVLRC